MGMEEQYDIIKKPEHYNRKGAMECFDEFLLIYGIEAAKYACLFNIHKYRYRAANKNKEEDLKKSDWYMNKYKELKEKQENKSNDPNKYTITIPYQPNNNNGIVTVPCHEEYPTDKDCWYNQPIRTAVGQN